MKTYLNFINKTLLTTCAFIISFMFATAVPVPAKFFVNSFVADVGQTVEFELKVEGTDTAPVYTVISNLDYNKDLLTFKSANTQSGWIAVSPDDVTDTANGVIKRTAGYPAGLKQLASIYKFSFVAKAPGDAVVNIAGGSAYDANNTDLGLQNKSITVKIGGVKEVTPEVTSAPTKEVAKVEAKKVPQTVDLKFVGQSGFATNKDYTFVLQHNLKVAQETFGSTTLALVDTNNNSIWSEVKDFTLSDSGEILFTIPANTIPAGNYVLNVGSTYDNHDNKKSPTILTKELGAVDGTKEIVKEEVKVPFIPMYVYIVAGAIFLLWLITLVYIKSKKFRKFLKNF